MEHRVHVVKAGPEVHHVGVLDPLFQPSCTCGWEGAWMLDEAEAIVEGRKHERELGEPTMLTDDTITDDDIRQLLATVLASPGPHERFQGHTIAGSCREALGEQHLHGSTKSASRRRCVEYLNKR